MQRLKHLVSNFYGIKIFNIDRFFKLVRLNLKCFKALINNKIFSFKVLFIFNFFYEQFSNINFLQLDLKGQKAT